MAEAQIVAPTVVDLKASLQHELDTLWGNPNEAKNITIFRTPYTISEGKKNLFEPSVISIGPFHHGKKHLRALEEQKMRFLRDFLSREDNISLDLCISEMKLLEMRTRRSYSEMFDDLDSNAFVKMMLLDGCFVLEYFLKLINPGFICIEEVGWNSIFIARELLLLENQIPFFIVDKLYEIGNLNQELHRTIFVKSIILNLRNMEDLDPLDSLYSLDSRIPDSPAEIHHLVHLFYHYLVPNPDKPVVLSSKSFDLTRMFSTNRMKGLLKTRFSHSMVIPSATELKQKGVKFTPNSNPKHLLDISFEYGVLKIPKLGINSDTNAIFANLLAFEHSKFDKEPTPFARFVIFLDKLVNTTNDVTILQECGIIENWLGSEEDVAHFLNQVSEGSFWDPDHYLVELFTEVNRYSESRWNRQRAILIRDYFNSPWAAISLVAALILLILTCLQSFYAVYAYKFPPSS